VALGGTTTTISHPISESVAVFYSTLFHAYLTENPLAGAQHCRLYAKEGSAADLPTSVEDVIKTMACVEAAYESSVAGGSKPEKWL
jgi:hypothetical protein